MLRFRRLLAILVAVAWITPALAAGAVAVHLALDHHDHATESVADDVWHAGEPAHQHAIEIGGDHGHALVPVKTTTLAGRSLPARSAAPAPAEIGFTGPEVALSAESPPTPPGPLFLSHCSFLI